MKSSRAAPSGSGAAVNGSRVLSRFSAATTVSLLLLLILLYRFGVANVFGPKTFPFKFSAQPSVLTGSATSRSLRVPPIFQSRITNVTSLISSSVARQPSLTPLFKFDKSSHRRTTLTSSELDGFGLIRQSLKLSYKNSTAALEDDRAFDNYRLAAAADLLLSQALAPKAKKSFSLHVSEYNLNGTPQTVLADSMTFHPDFVGGIDGSRKCYVKGNDCFQVPWSAATPDQRILLFTLPEGNTSTSSNDDDKLWLILPANSSIPLELSL